MGGFGLGQGYFGQYSLSLTAGVVASFAINSPTQLAHIVEPARHLGLITH